MSFPGFALRTLSIDQHLYTSQAPGDNFAYYDFGRPRSLTYETDDFVSVGDDAGISLGAGGSGSEIGAALLVELQTWNDIILVDSLLMPGIIYLDETCPHNTVLNTEEVCEVVTQLIAESGVTPSISEESSGVLVLVEEGSNIITITSES